jgi:nitrogen fixation protein FixH
MSFTYGREALIVRSKLLAALATALVLLLGACGAPGGGDLNRQQQTIDGLTFTFESPRTPSVLEQVQFRVTLTDGNGNGVEGADVYLDMTMPAMPMGKNAPIADEQGGGVYTAQGIFDMAGDWELDVHAAVDGEAYMATFTSVVVEQ